MNYLLIMAVILASVVGCGFGGKDGKDGEDGYTCVPSVDDSGVLFVCSDGQSYRVDNGKLGPVGPRGERGPVGPQGLPGKDGKDGVDGKGLTVESTKVCNGELEGWLENSSYKIEFKSMLFSTGNVLANGKVSLMKGEEVINSRPAADFFMDESSGIFLDVGSISMKLEGDVLSVKSKGGLDAEIPCEVK